MPKVRKQKTLKYSIPHTDYNNNKKELKVFEYEEGGYSFSLVGNGRSFAITNIIVLSPRQLEEYGYPNGGRKAEGEVARKILNENVSKSKDGSELATLLNGTGLFYGTFSDKASESNFKVIDKIDLEKYPSLKKVLEGVSLKDPDTFNPDFEGYENEDGLNSFIEEKIYDDLEKAIKEIGEENVMAQWLGTKFNELAEGDLNDLFAFKWDKEFETKFGDYLLVTESEFDDAFYEVETNVGDYSDTSKFISEFEDRD